MARYWQQQVDRIDNETAHAPYNFVPLPEAVFAPPDKATYGAKGFPRYDQFREDLHTGYFECALEALTPIYIRGPRRQGEAADSRLRPDFYAIDKGGGPVLPGSSLRGVIRSLYEVLTFSRVDPVNPQKAGGEVPPDASESDFVAPAELNTYPGDTGAPDLASRLFGFISGSDQLRGRLRFTNARYTGGHNDPYVGILIAPKLLLSPHPSSYRMYLVQTSEDPGARRTYRRNRSSGTEIRGTKFYWHKWNTERGLAAVQEQTNHSALVKDLSSPRPRDTTHTIIRCVKAGSRFGFRIWFQNLADIELAALRTVLNPGSRYALKAGMGKPLGLGSVRISADLYTFDMRRRYGSWMSGADLMPREQFGRMVKAFSQAIVAHCIRTGECPSDCASMLQVPRIRELFTLLEAFTPENWGQVEYMTGPATGVLPLASEVSRGKLRPL